MIQIYTRYDEVLQKFIEANSEPCIVRLSKLLYEVAIISSDEVRNVRLENYLSRQDMACYVGTHVTNISKYLNELEYDGIIERYGKVIVIKDLVKLKDRL